MRIGPYTHTVRSCGGCQHHKAIMLHSGPHPLYWHYCKHPAVHEEFEEIGFKGKIMGKFIGETDTTPSWCPAAKAKAHCGRKGGANMNKIDTKKLSDYVADVMEEIAQRENLVPKDNSHKAFRMYASVMSKSELFKEALAEGFRRYKDNTND